MAGRHGQAHERSGAVALVRFGGRIVAALLSVVVLVSFGYGWKNYRDLDSGLKRIAVQGLGVAPSAGATPVAVHQGTDENILIVGNDDRNDMTDAEVKALHTGRDGGSINTDTMMIAHIPADGSAATLISLPRDSYVDIPGFRSNKLNAAYPDGYFTNAPADASDAVRRAAGASQLIKTIRLLTGLQIDHFIQVDLIGFYRISMAIGPITVNLCSRVDDPNSGLHLPAGINNIVGRTALAFVRQRETLAGGDLARVQRQRYFLTAAFRKIASARTLISPSRLHNLIVAVDKSVYVDAGFSIQSIAEQLANLSANNIVGRTIPIEDERIIDGVGDVLIVNPAKVKAFVHRLVVGPPARPSPTASTAPRPPSPSSPSPSPSPSPSSTKPAIDAGCIP